MRRILAATVLASPFFLSAAAMATPVTDAAASTPARPLSTGVKPAHVLSSRGVDAASICRSPGSKLCAVGAEVVLSLNVDEKGRAQSIQVVNSSNHQLDGPVAESVSHYCFRPATLDNQPVNAPMTLAVLVQRSASSRPLFCRSNPQAAGRVVCWRTPLHPGDRFWPPGWRFPFACDLPPTSALLSCRFRFLALPPRLKPRHARCPILNIHARFRTNSGSLQGLCLNSSIRKRKT